MKIVIAGAGGVGFHLAELLSNQSKDIYLIDNDMENLASVSDKLDAICTKADASSVNTLKSVGISEAELLIAVTDSQSTNIVIAALAKKLGAKTTIARIANTEFLTTKEFDFRDFGIDKMICPEALAAQEIITLANESDFNDKVVFENGLFNILGAVLKQNSILIGKNVKDTKQKFKNIDFIVIAIKRNQNDATLIPKGDTVFELGDQVYFSVPENSVDKIHRLIGNKHLQTKNVMIVGGSKIGKMVAQKFCEKGMDVKLIESNKKKAHELANEIPQALVIAEDGCNVDLLKEESIEHMDAFVAVTGNSQANIMACLVAKSKGVKKNIALIEDEDYMNISQTIGIDTLVNKKILAASAICRYVRKGKVLSMANLHNVDAEVLEFFVQRGTPITKKPIKDLKLKNSIVFGGVIRNKTPLTIFGDFQIQKGDRVIVFCLNDAIEEVENLFKK